MKIIQISASYKPAYIYGGPIMSVAKLCEALEEVKSESQKVGKSESYEDFVSGNWDGKIEVEVFTTTANSKVELDVEPNRKIIVDGVKVTYFKRLTKDHTHFSPALLWALRKEIILNKEQRAKNKDQKSKTKEHGLISENEEKSHEKRATKNDLIIHIHAWWNLVSILSCLVAKWYKIPVLLSPRGMLTSYTLGNRNSFSKRLIHFLIGKNLLRYCHIHATSEKEKEDILAVIKPKSITVIPNLVELEKVRSPKSEVRSGEEGTRSKEQRAKNKEQRTKTEEHGLVIENEKRATNKETFKLIFLSRIEEKKGLDLLFDALATLDFDWSLTIAGSGNENYLDRLKRKAESGKLDDRINWVGQIDKKDKFKLLEEHELLVLTSYNENFANVVIESLSVGTPVLISKEVGLYDYVANKKMGWITDLDTLCIKAKLLQSFEAIEERKQIRINAPELIHSDFNDKKLIGNYLSLYQEII